MRFWPSLVVVALAAACAAPPVPPPPSARCLAELDRRGVRYVLAAPPARSACPIAGAVRVSAEAIPWNQSAIVDCDFAVTLDDFARDDIVPLARAYFGESVAVIRHFGAYACRTTRDGKDSLHALGRAIDIAGVELADGTRISVERDWRRPGPAGAFLHAVARAACRRFSMVLTPDSDADHYNHIHLDNGPFRRCGA